MNLLHSVPRSLLWNYNLVTRLIFIAAIALAIYMFMQKSSTLPVSERKSFYIKSGFWALMAMLVALAATGRMHWISVVIASLVPIIKSLFNLAIRYLPLLTQTIQNRQQNTQQPVTHTDLSEDEAWQILGLTPDANKEDIILAHKKLMQKIHPDRGGNDYLASRINQAKELLIKKFS